jgi:hypothetical protein
LHGEIYKHNEASSDGDPELAGAAITATTIGWKRQAVSPHIIAGNDDEFDE